MQLPSTTFYLNGSGAAYNAGTVFQLGYTGASTDIATVNAGLLSAGTSVIVAGVAGSAGTLNLDGGTVKTPTITNGGGTAIVNFNGGTLQAAAASTTFMTGLTSANIFSGGATIDSNGNAITIGQALLAPTGSGLSSITLAGGGTGYIGAPEVTITGGGGTGASAVATINPATGVVTGFTITSPGTGYTSAPTVTITGGGGTGATATTATTANTSGGLTKIGTGTLTLSGANTYTGSTTVNAGTLTLSGTGTVSTNGDVLVTSGTASGTAGVINQSAGTVTTGGGNNQMILSAGAGTYGDYNLSGGTLNIGTLRAGGSAANAGGNSYFVQTGGTVNLSNAAFIGRSGDGLATSVNTFYLNGAAAQYNVANNFDPGYAGGSTDLATVSAGTLSVAGNIILTNGGAGETAIFNLNGGTVKTQSIGTGGGISYLNFNGGTLQAAANNTTFLNGNGATLLTGANIFSSGATIDTNGFADTIVQPLLAPTGNGLSSIAVTTGGAGYIGAPEVTITGGGGTGASAIAIVSGGVVTGYTITSPGTGYTSAPTVTLSGGGATTAATATAGTPVANTSGGLTKVGLGTLTLSGISTYTGGTTVNAGTLILGNGGGAGAVRGVVNVNSGATLTLGVNNALGYNAGTQVTTLNINGGLVNVSGNNGDEGFITSFNLTGGTLAYATTNGSAYQINAADASAPGITSNASSTTSLISGGLNIRGGTLGFNVASGSTPSGIDLNVTGAITGGANSISKSGPGTLQLAGANTYSGTTTISAGTLNLSGYAGFRGRHGVSTSGTGNL